MSHRIRAFDGRGVQHTARVLSRDSNTTRGGILDLARELERGGMLLPEEQALVGRAVFLPQPPMPESVDVCLILGSRHCDYRVRQAFSACDGPGVRYVASGGGRMESGVTEAAFMRKLLRELGVVDSRILVDESSLNTAENLRHSLPLIEALTGAKGTCNLVLVTGGFHMVRTMDLARRIFAESPQLRVFPLNAYGPNTAPDNWHSSASGRSVIAAELVKIHALGLLAAGAGAHEVRPYIH